MNSSAVFVFVSPQAHQNPSDNWSEKLLRRLHVPNIMHQNVPNKPLDYYTCEFKISKLHKYVGTSKLPPLFVLCMWAHHSYLPCLCVCEHITVISLVCVGYVGTSQLAPLFVLCMCGLITVSSLVCVVCVWAHHSYLPCLCMCEHITVISLVCVGYVGTSQLAPLFVLCVCGHITVISLVCVCVSTSQLSPLFVLGMWEHHS